MPKGTYSNLRGKNIKVQNNTPNKKFSAEVQKVKSRMAKKKK